MQKRFKLAPKPLFFIYVVTHWLYSVQLGYSAGKDILFYNFALCGGWCELQMCMALALAIVSIYQLKINYR
tara:strand:- start:1214 stop:1426 length:213 start_codon:yes stop_codon:yes gene_type:complete